MQPLSNFFRMIDSATSNEDKVTSVYKLEKIYKLCRNTRGSQRVGRLKFHQRVVSLNFHQCSCGPMFGWSGAVGPTISLTRDPQEQCGCKRWPHPWIVADMHHHGHPCLVEDGPVISQVGFRWWVDGNMPSNLELRESERVTWGGLSWNRVFELKIPNITGV